MSREADFPQTVKEALAKRAGYRCSFPGCPNQTIGPSAEGPTKVSNTGDAAHIVAASPGPGARRPNTGRLSNEKLMAIENGVWMCAYHARVVDRDEITYTIPMLEKWRAITEHKASLRQQLGRDIDFGLRELSGILLAEHKVELGALGSENQEIGEALLHSGVHEIWGDSLAKAVRDLSIEMIRNAFQHGSATRFSISVEPKRIVLKDDGQVFRYDDILAQERKSGGAAAMRRVIDQYSNRVVLSQTHNAQGNELTIALIHSLCDIPEVTECSYTLTRKELWALPLPIPSLPQCDKIYVMLPTYASYSDGISLVHILKRSGHDLKRYIIVGQGLSEGLVEDMRASLPECSVMNLP
jgi:hypothetical protein